MVAAVTKVPENETFKTRPLRFLKTPPHQRATSIQLMQSMAL